MQLRFSSFSENKNHNPNNYSAENIKSENVKFIKSTCWSKETLDELHTNAAHILKGNDGKNYSLFTKYLCFNLSVR